MTELSLLDAAALLFVLLQVLRARSRSLGDSLHGLIALLLLVALFMGFRMTSEVRALLSDVAGMMRAIPGLGSKLLIIVAAWYLMRLLRKQSGYWIEAAVPRPMHRRILPLTEGLRAALLAGFLVWLAEGWFDEAGPDVPMTVRAVRIGDAWVARQIRGLSAPQARPYPQHPPPWAPRG